MQAAKGEVGTGDDPESSVCSFCSTLDRGWMVDRLLKPPALSFILGTSRLCCGARFTVILSELALDLFSTS